jgi:hypothetical protein
MRGLSLKINSADVRHRILAHDAGGRLNPDERHCSAASSDETTRGLEILGYEAEPWKVASAENKARQIAAMMVKTFSITSSDVSTKPQGLDLR